MPIRINLLAEEQAAEEMRRRDPVKRAIAAGALAVVLVLVWIVWFQVRLVHAKRQLTQLQAAINSHTNQYQLVQADEAKLESIQLKLSALHQLATNRFLWANVLNALQQTTVDDVHLVQLRGEQSYILTEETKPTTNELGRIVPGKPATATEKIVLKLDAKDIGQTGEGHNILKYAEAISQFPYFRQVLGRTNQVRLSSRAPPEEDKETGRKVVKFTLECPFEEKTR